MVEISLATLGRRKIIDFDHTPLPRVLTLFDLTTLGIGTTIGVGFYILAGDVAQSKAGPAVIISFLIAAITSVFAGLCYAEFGGRVPKAGSAYIYTYVCIGEFIAFIIGWNLILEYVIATASVASGYSHYIDAMANDAISEALGDAMPIDVSFLGPYPDFLAAALVIILSIVLAFGVKESSMFNNIMTVVNMFVVLFVIICTATLAKPENWSLSVTDLNETCPKEQNDNGDWTVIYFGSGGFAPFGFQGIMAGAAACFYGFVGFDVIASTGTWALSFLAQ
ncbi:Amino acid/polyamine transporter I [Trinorchestia longiramus]|nr:Amino acid/polyamine transporter I [Trinorchestia longiramus]